MRLFPRAPRADLLAVLVACLLVAGIAAVPLANAEDLKKKQKQVQQQIHQAHDELEHSSTWVRSTSARVERALARLAVAKRRLGTAQARLAAAQARDAQMRERLAAAEARLAEAQADVVAGQEAVARQRTQVVDTVTTIYQEGDPALLGISAILDARDPSDLIRRMEANDAIVARQTSSYDKLRAAEVLLRVRESQVEEVRQEVAVQRAAAAKHLQTMRALHREAVVARQQVRSHVISARSARRAALAARRYDRAVLARLKKRENRIRQQILAAARKSRGGYRGASNGFFDYPVNGAVTSPFGYRIHPIYRYRGFHDGTDFGAGCGAPLRAVADGRVMSKYYSSVYGNRLYLNVGRVNGRFLTAVYNHATRYVVSPGEHVRRGELVGYVGSTGWSTGCHLHFTVLANGNAVNPMKYL